MNDINEILFSPQFCLDLFKVIYNKKEYLFIGRVTKEELEIINKIKEDKNLSFQEKKALADRYGKTAVDILSEKITLKTIFIQEVILLNDNIKTIKEKIFYSLSNKYGNPFLDIDKQYLFSQKIMDYGFITSIIPNLFMNKKILSRDEIIFHLNKIMKTNIFKFKQEKYKLEELQDYFTRLVNSNTYIYHDIGLSQSLVNLNNDKNICDYIDINKNKDNDSIFAHRKINNDFLILNNIINQTKYDDENNIKMNQDIHLVYLDELSKKEKNYEYLLNQYFPFVSKDKKNDYERKRMIDSLDELYEKQSITFKKILYNLKSKQLNIINYVKIIKKNIITLNIDLYDLYKKINVSEDIPFINIKYTKLVRNKPRNETLFKLHKPVFNTRSQLTSKILDNWKNGTLDMDYKERKYDNSDELLFRENNFMHLVIKFENNYLAFYLSTEGKILVIFPILKKKKKDKLEEMFFKYMAKINDIVQDINNILNNIEKTNTPDSKVYDLKKSIIPIDETNIKNIKMNFTKSIPLSNIPNLNTVFKEMNLFFYSSGKNVYGLKNINNFGTDEYIVNYVIDRFFNDDKITFEKIAPEIAENFNRSDSDVKKILQTIDKDTKDDKIKNKRNNELNKAEVFFYNDLGKRQTKINFTCHNINQLVFVNNLINLMVKELNDFTNRKKTKKISQSVKKSFISIPKSSESNNNNNSDFSLLNNDSNNNTNSSKSSSSNSYQEEIVPERIDDLEYNGLTVSQYFRNMRKKYDEKFFKGNYTRSCPATEDRIPVIVSKALWEYIAKNKRFSDGLDKYKEDSIDDEKYRIITGSEDIENVYICPRIYCVRCMVPIKTDEFIKKDLRCPFCNGKPTKVKGVRGRFDEEHTVKIRGDDYWKNNKWEKIQVDCADCLRKMKYIDYYKNDYKCIKCDSENVKVDENEIIPFLLDIKKQKLKIPAILESSLSPMFPRKKPGSVPPCCDKNAGEKRTKDSKENIFKDSSTKLTHDEIGLLPSDLNELLNNNNSIQIKNGTFVTTEGNKKKIFYKYKFYEKTKILAFDKKKTPINRKLIFRLGNNYVKESNSFILALHKLKCIEELIENKSLKERSKFSFKEITDNIDLLTYASVNNGNLNEMFRSKQTIGKENYQELNLQVDENSIRELNNSLQNFKAYCNNKNEFKNYTHYVELLGRSGILFKNNYNIVVIDKVLGEDKNIRINCPLYSYNSNYETIFVIKFIDEKNKEYFEPIIKINLDKVERPIQYSFPENDKNFINVFKIIKDICLKNLHNKPYNLYDITNIVNQTKFKIDYHVINKHFKVVGVILNNSLFIPIFPSGINNKISILKNKKFEIIGINFIEILPYEEFLSKSKEFLDEIKNKNIDIYPEFLQELRQTKSNGNINGLILKDNLFVPIKDGRGKNNSNQSNNLESEFKINNLIYNKNNIEQNQKDEYLDLKIKINRLLLRKENKDINKELKKIIFNPVLIKKDKKLLIIKILGQLNLDVPKKHINKLIDELLSNTKNTRLYLKQRFRTKKISQNNNILLDDFNNIRRGLYGTKKLKYEREIKQFNTKKIKDIDIGNKFKVNNIGTIKNTPISIKRSIKIKKKKNIVVPEVQGTNFDMFGYDKSKDPEEKNLKPGKCKLPFKTRYNSYTGNNNKKQAQNTEYFYDCLPTSDGPICPTGDIGEDEVFKKNKHHYAYCNYDDYFDRQEKYILNNGVKKFNEDECSKEPMFIRRKTEDGIQRVPVTKKCIINQDRKKTAFDKKNPSETFKCLKKTKKGAKLFTSKDSADCFI